MQVEALKAIKACLKRLFNAAIKSESVKESEKNFYGATISHINY